MNEMNILVNTSGDKKRGRPRRNYVKDLQYLLRWRSEQLAGALARNEMLSASMRRMEAENIMMKRRLDSLADYEACVEEFMALKAYVAQIQRLI